MTMTQHYFPRVWPIGTEITAAGIFLCGNLIAKSSLPDPRRVQTESSRAGPALVQGFDSFLNPAPVLAPGGLAHRGTEDPAKSNASRSECRQNVSSHFCILHPLPGALLNLTRLRGMALMQVKRPLPDARRAGRPSSGLRCILPPTGSGCRLDGAPPGAFSVMVTPPHLGRRIARPGHVQDFWHTTRIPASLARRTMSAVPRPPGNASTRSGLPSSSICWLRLGPPEWPKSTR